LGKAYTYLRTLKKHSPRGCENSGMSELKEATPGLKRQESKEPANERRWDMQEILPGLFLGPTSVKKIKEEDFQAVLCARGELAPKIPADIPMLWLQGFLETSDLGDWLPRCVEFLNTQWKDGKKKTLVCCATGVGRAPVIMAIYVCLVRKWDGEVGFNKAVDDITEKRVCSFGYPELNNHFFPQALSFLDSYDMASFTIHMPKPGSETVAPSLACSPAGASVEFCDDLTCANPMPCAVHPYLVRVKRGAQGIKYTDGFGKITGADTGIVVLEVARGAFAKRRAAFDITPWPTPVLEGIQFRGVPQEDKSQYNLEFYGQGEGSGFRIVFSPQLEALFNEGGDLVFINQYR